ncbi:GntR family transcriptional regulator [Streptomyces sp. NBC_00996]|uniref:GntR family transcriptional regulator n=1 Tax=Streptomyces sp. NBC_00996 TaxID=2903710 RepID=UPI0038683437|nr:UTRA domain-containing protein [Streptomyces sp. NBC_00996]
MSAGEWISTSMPYLTPREHGQLDAWSAELAARGRRGSQRVVYAGEVLAPPGIAELLGVSGGETVVVRRRIIHLGDEPSELTDTYYPLAIARGTRLASTAKIRGGAVTLLAELGHAGARVQEDVVARMPTEDERGVLRTADDEPVLQLTRLTLDRDDRPIQVDRMVMPAHRQRLRYEIRIGDRAQS